MSDAQVDGGDTGQRGEDLANNVIGDRDPAEVVYWYGGVYSGIWVLISIYGYMLLNKSFYNDIFLVMSSTWFKNLGGSTILEPICPYLWPG